MALRNLRQCIGKLKYRSSVSPIKVTLKMTTCFHVNKFLHFQRFRCTTSLDNNEALQKETQPPTFLGFSDAKYVSKLNITLPEHFEKVRQNE